MFKLILIVLVSFISISNLFSQTDIKISNSYYENSKILISQGYKKGDLMHGKWIYYYSTGSIKSIEYFYEGKPVGNYKEFYENGKPKVEGYYGIKTIEKIEKDTLKDGEVVKVYIKSSCRIGGWKFYDEKGNLKTKHYKDCKER